MLSLKRGLGFGYRVSQMPFRAESCYTLSAGEELSDTLRPIPYTLFFLNPINVSISPSEIPV